MTASNLQKIVDYRSISLQWLMKFRDELMEGTTIASEVVLVVATEDIGTGSFFVEKGETLLVEENVVEDPTLTVSRPYGIVRKGDVSKQSVVLKSRNDWTTEDVCEYVVKHACMRQRWTYLEKMPSKFVSGEEHKGAFVSHARKCKFNDLVSALTYYFVLKPGGDVMEQFVWLDVFCVNQPELTAGDSMKPEVRQANEEQLKDGLHVAIAKFEERLLFIDKWDNPTIFTRAWCIWEVFGVVRAKKTLDVALPKSEYDRFIETLSSERESILAKVAKINVEDAECVNQADLEMIRGEILKHASFDKLDKLIKSQLRLWVANTGKSRVEKEEQQKCPDWTEVTWLAYNAGQLYESLNDKLNAQLLLYKAVNLCKMAYKDVDHKSKEDKVTLAAVTSIIAFSLIEQVRARV